jgi:hypothetical protein
MCELVTIVYKNCRCTWGTERFRCDLQTVFSKRCPRYYHDIQEWRDPDNCPRHIQEQLETGGDDWDYEGGRR